MKFIYKFYLIFLGNFDDILQPNKKHLLLQFQDLQVEIILIITHELVMFVILDSAMRT